jgi:hypothetical protein
MFLFLFFYCFIIEAISATTPSAAELLCGCDSACPFIENVTSYPHPVDYAPVVVNFNSSLYDWMGELKDVNMSEALYLYANDTSETIQCQHSDLVFGNVSVGPIIPLVNIRPHVCNISILSIAGTHSFLLIENEWMMRRRRRLTHLLRMFLSLRGLSTHNISIVISPLFPEHDEGRQLAQCGYCGCEGLNANCAVMIVMLFLLLVIMPCAVIVLMMTYSPELIHKTCIEWGCKRNKKKTVVLSKQKQKQKEEEGQTNADKTE